MGYFERGAVADLVQTRNAISARVRGSEEYRVVLRPVEKSGGRAKAWQSWREKALTQLRGTPKRANRSSGARWARPGHTLLVEIFLHEGNSDAALAEAKAGGCTGEAWIQLARARDHDHPQDAADICRKFIDGIVDRRSNQAYVEAGALAGQIKELMQQAGQEGEFAAWVASLRMKHRAKRNFMRQIEGL